MNDRPRFALRFIMGKYQGSELPLRMNREIFLGRSRDLDVALVDDLVSRCHAKISVTASELFIQDMGSTNGTFVNGEKISERVMLQEGDRVLIGSSIIRIVPFEGTSNQTLEAEVRRWLDAEAQQQYAHRSSPATATSGRPMAGVIEEIPLPDLLQLLSTSRKNGALTVNNSGRLGKIYLRKGVIYYATIDNDYALTPQQAIYNMLTWETGAFELEPNVELKVMDEIKESTEALLMEGMRLLDEARNPHKPPPSSDPVDPDLDWN
ncbi:MAG TPA: DUF4388 domain-containing protein [Kofleriaceae bacterium]|nr:DUF4388 domain-containing protein [Kofleriaceae bacterium]